MVDKVLERTMFEVSREMEYFTEKELSYQTGRNRAEWPMVILKELLDNALDACENVGISPELEVDIFDRHGFLEISVKDNGPGLKRNVVRKVLNYKTRTSDKDAYVSPTRGAQGNALKTVFAIPYILSSANPQEGTCEIESYGVRHIVKIKLDAIKQRPQIMHEQIEIVKSRGCKVTAWLDNASIIDDHYPKFLQILEDYQLFNPHLRLLLRSNVFYEHRPYDKNGERTTDESCYVPMTSQGYEPTNPSWTKWRPNDFTSPLWYTVEDLKKLIRSHISLIQDRGKDLTLREFVAQFRGITSTAKQKSITEQLPEIKRLSQFVDGNDVDSNLVGQLLLAMKGITRVVPPHALGVIGEDHFKVCFKDREVRYVKKVGIEDNKPFVVEVAYIHDEGLEGVRFHFGLNFAPAASDPFQELRLLHATKKEDFDGRGIKGLAAQYGVSSWDKVHVVCHIAYPRFRFKDRGKSILEYSNGE